MIVMSLFLRNKSENPVSPQPSQVTDMEMPLPSKAWQPVAARTEIERKSGSY
jgi:hypothetical protein